MSDQGRGLLSEIRNVYLQARTVILWKLLTGGRLTKG
jgi:hypothetical protein